MPRSNSPAPAVPQTYAALRKAVENAIVKGQRAAELAKVRTYHETGRLIRQHLIAHDERADYGAKLFLRLAADLNIDRSVLQRCDQFYRAFPNCATWHKLTWAHYRVLVPVEDPKLRRSLAIEADRNGWAVTRLEQRIRAVLPAPLEDGAPSSDAGPTQKPLVPRRGTLDVCRVIADGDAVAVDLGFACYLRPSAGDGLSPNDFVRVTAKGMEPVPGATKADLFTYGAEVLKVVDGDTLWVRVFLRPDQWIKQKLRLRVLDCPEIDTPEGKAAKRFVETLVARSERVTICTTKPDKYDRYLADVFLHNGEGEIFLNNALLANGHAIRKDGGYTPADWDA